MTTANEQSEKQAEKERLKARSADMEKREKELNSGKTGKGLREFLGMTRGKHSQEIQFQNWDDSKPETLPVTVDEFMTLSGVTEEKDLLRRLILGDNEVRYSEASDPVAEFVDSSWPEDVQKAFKIGVKNYSANAGVSIEDAVDILKPGFEKGVATRAAKLAAEKAEEKPTE